MLDDNQVAISSQRLAGIYHFTVCRRLYNGSALVADVDAFVSYFAK